MRRRRRTCTTTSSSAPVPPAACSPTASAKIPTSRCCCSKPARATGIPSSTCPRAWPSWPARSASTGTTAPPPSRSSTTACCGGRAARCWAAPVRSTPCATSAASPRDYDDWAAQGAPRLGLERGAALLQAQRRQRARRRCAAWRRRPAAVSDLRHVNPLSQAFIEAGQQAGFARNDDFNGARQLGVGLYQVTQKDGARCSAAVGVPQSGEVAAQPHHPHRRAGQPHHLRCAVIDIRAPTA